MAHLPGVEAGPRVCESFAESLSLLWSCWARLWVPLLLGLLPAARLSRWLCIRSGGGWW